jgi:hypothetical protein
MLCIIFESRIGISFYYVDTHALVGFDGEGVFGLIKLPGKTHICFIGYVAVFIEDAYADGFAAGELLDLFNECIK